MTIALENQYGVIFRNRDGDWTIWKNCYENPGAVIGPAYVGRVSSGGKTLLNDESGSEGGTNARRGGLGTFGVHYTRGNPPYALEGHPFVYEISGRTCSDGGSPGVYRVDITQGPLLSGGVGVFDATVWLRDQWGSTGVGPDSDGNGTGDAGIRLDYTTRVYASVVKQWVTVTTYFTTNYEGIPFAKEPKFTGSLPNTAAGYRRASVWGNSDGLTYLKALYENKPLGGVHADENNRLRVRYDFATALGGTAAHGCNGTIRPCLNVLFRAINPANGAWTFWEGGGYGLDRWATDVGGSSAPRISADDRPNANPNNGLNTPWNCNATSDTSAPFSAPEESTTYFEVRRWELGGINTGANFSPYSQLMLLATGWEGGRGAFDCESTYRAFPAGTSYRVEMDYSVDAGW